MNTTRIAAWFLLLIMGAISARAVTGMQTRVLDGSRPSLDAGTQSEGEINDKNWQNNPKIIAIRKIVNSAHAEVCPLSYWCGHRAAIPLSRPFF